MNLKDILTWNCLLITPFAKIGGKVNFLGTNGGAVINTVASQQEGLEFESTIHLPEDPPISSQSAKTCS